MKKENNGSNESDEKTDCVEIILEREQSNDVREESLLDELFMSI